MLNQILQVQAIADKNTDFQAWLDANPRILFQFAFYLVYNLPAPRYSYYEAASYQAT
jgi:hypothetical protein